MNERFELVAESLASDRDNLEGTLENLRLLSDEGALLVQESGDDLGRSFGRLDRVLGTVLSHQDQLSKGIQWSNVIAQALGETDASGRGRFAYSGLQAAPGSARAAYNYRIDSRDIIACERIGVLVHSLLTLLPGSTPEDIRISVLSFIPETYRDDIAFIVDLLIPLCSELKGGPAVEQQVERTIRRAAASMGTKRFIKALSAWTAESLATGGSR